jgi:hypothetical protein
MRQPDIASHLCSAPGSCAGRLPDDISRYHPERLTAATSPLQQYSKWLMHRRGRPRVDHRPWAASCYPWAPFKMGNHFGFRFSVTVDSDCMRRNSTCGSTTGDVDALDRIDARRVAHARIPISSRSATRRATRRSHRSWIEVQQTDRLNPLASSACASSVLRQLPVTTIVPSIPVSSWGAQQ